MSKASKKSAQGGQAFSSNSEPWNTGDVVTAVAADAAVDVLDLVERTASSLMGAFLFLIFGLAKDQVLVRHISDAVARLREPRSPAPSPSGFTEQWF